jgi:hypothetical protein
MHKTAMSPREANVASRKKGENIKPAIFRKISPANPGSVPKRKTPMISAATSKIGIKPTRMRRVRDCTSST